MAPFNWNRPTTKGGFPVLRRAPERHSLVDHPSLALSEVLQGWNNAVLDLESSTDQSGMVEPGAELRQPMVLRVQKGFEVLPCAVI
jgi:hypothetical protein